MSKECPVCGNPHDTWGGVAMHMCKMSDDAHAHVESKDGGLELLAREGHMSGDVSDGGSDDGGDDVDNPTFGNADPDADEGDDEGEVELPCGCESYDESEAPEPPYRVECSQCGGEWRVTA